MTSVYMQADCSGPLTIKLNRAQKSIGFMGRRVRYGTVGYKYALSASVPIARVLVL